MMEGIFWIILTSMPWVIVWLVGLIVYSYFANEEHKKKKADKLITHTLIVIVVMVVVFALLIGSIKFMDF